MTRRDFLRIAVFGVVCGSLLVVAAGNSGRADFAEDRIGFEEFWAGSIATIPDGYLFCNGAAVSRTTYARLFAKISTIHGVGNGSTTFNIPDRRDKFIIGAKQDESGVPKSNIEGSLNPSGGSGAQPPVTDTPSGVLESVSTEGSDAAGGESHTHIFVPPYSTTVIVIRYK